MVPFHIFRACNTFGTSMYDNQPWELASQGTSSMLPEFLLDFHWIGMVDQIIYYSFPFQRSEDQGQIKVRSSWDPGSKLQSPNHMVGLSGMTSSHAEVNCRSSTSSLISITQVRSVGPAWITMTFLPLGKCLGLRDFLPETTDKGLINSLHLLLILSGICHNNFVK